VQVRHRSAFASVWSEVGPYARRRLIGPAPPIRSHQEPDGRRGGAPLRDRLSTRRCPRYGGSTATSTQGRRQPLLTTASKYWSAGLLWVQQDVRPEGAQNRFIGAPTRAPSWSSLERKIGGMARVDLSAKPRRPRHAAWSPPTSAGAPTAAVDMLGPRLRSLGGRGEWIAVPRSAGALDGRARGDVMRFNVEVTGRSARFASNAWQPALSAVRPDLKLTGGARPLLRMW
jgi:hypothetical protein